MTHPDHPGDPRARPLAIDRRVALLAVPALASACAGAPPARAVANTELVRQVTAAENAFAQTIVERDLAAFERFLAPDAVFLNGGKPLVGRAAIVAFWSRFYERAAPPPFTWKPDLVAVLDSGRLGYSSGPVTGPDGAAIARFHSTWRLDDDGRWRVVFDNGASVCAAPKAIA